MLSSTGFSLVVVPGDDSRVRRYRIPGWLAGFGLLTVLVATAVVTGVAARTIDLAPRFVGNAALADENQRLRAQLERLHGQADQLHRTVARLEQLETGLRAKMDLDAPDPSLAIGPVGVRDEHVDAETPHGLPAVSELLATSNAEWDRAHRSEASLQALYDYVDAQRERLVRTPSVWPAEGFTTSEFGVRNDPYTRSRVMHKGLDIGGDIGDQIHSAADGAVIWVGARGGYGITVVVDHGYGLQTHYCHLDRARVKQGQRVRRRDLVGLMGTTGRSTGPHLHYEVRLNGIPKDPRRFILD